jgi:hypothetical protein
LGEIKPQLAPEAETDRLRDQQAPAAPATPAPATPALDQRSSLLGTVFTELFIG